MSAFLIIGVIRPDGVAAATDISTVGDREGRPTASSQVQFTSGTFCSEPTDYLELSHTSTIESNFTKTRFRGSTKLVLIIRDSSYQDIVIHVQYYSKPNRARKIR